MWHPVAICGACGRQHLCERLVNEPADFQIICHACETPLRVSVTAEEVTLQNYADGQTWQGPFYVHGAPRTARSSQ